LSTTLAPGLAQSILAAAPLVLYVYDVQNERSVFQNRRFGEILGHPPIDRGLSEWKHYIHPDDAAEFSAYRERLKSIEPDQTLHWHFRMRDARGEWRWFHSRDVLMSSDDAAKPLLIVGSASDVTEQKRAEEYKDLLAGEMRHRAKNLAAVVQAMARQSRPKDQPAAAAYIDTFVGRLLTLLNTGDIVLSSATRTADLAALLELAIAPFLDEDEPHRIVIHNGPPVILSEHSAGGLALAVHELATNAVKYGALSVSSGSVALNWSVASTAGDRRLVLEWREQGGPSVSPPSSEGFGTRVIRQSIAHEPKAKVSLDYRADGLRCCFEFEMPPA